MAQKCYLRGNCLYVYPERFSHLNMCNKNFSQYFIKHTYDLFKSNQLSYFYSLTRSIFRWLKNIIFRVIVCTFTLKDFPTQTCAIKISLNILLNTPTICSNWTNPTILFLFFDQEYLQVAQKCYLQDNRLYVYPKRISHPNMCNKNVS